MKALVFKAVVALLAAFAAYYVFFLGSVAYELYGPNARWCGTAQVWALQGGALFFAPPALLGFPATTNPSDSRSGPLPVIDSREELSPSASAGGGPRPGLPSSVVDLSTPAVLSHPGEPGRCIRSLLRGRCWLRHIWLVGRSQMRNEAGTGSHDITADVFVRRRLRRRDCSRRRCGNYMCAEQFT